MSGARRAILIGNAAFPNEKALPDLRCPLNDVSGLAEQLGDPERGAFETVVCLEDADSGAVKRGLNGFLRAASPTDTVLIYYSGHGKLDDGFALHLCTSDSEVDLLESTSVPSDFIWNLLGKCPAKRSVVLLDCCYSGAAAGRVGRGSVEERLRMEASGTGAYLITAADAIETAQEKEGDRYGVFTKHLIAGLESGAADSDGDGHITMDGLYHYVCDHIRVDAPQTPKREVGGHGDIVIAKSGKDPRGDRAAKTRRLLYGHVADGTLSAKAAELAVKVSEKRPSEMSGPERAVDGVLSDFLDSRIKLGDFADRLHAAGSTRAKPDHKPAKQPEPAKPIEDETPSARTPSPLTPRNEMLVRSYAVPAGVLFVVLPVLATLFMGNGLVPGLAAMGLIGWNLAGVRDRMGMGGLVANTAVLLMSVLVFVAGFFG